MSANLQKFIERYREGFDAYLRDRDERALTRAYELRRSAVAQELSVLDLASAHQDVLLDSMQPDSDSTSREHVIHAAGDFFIEGVSAFEVATRALQDAREPALVERRHATILRPLTTFLADASLALDASESLHEMVQLVAEHARELTDAERCAVRLSVDDDVPAVDAFAVDQLGPGLESQTERTGLALPRARAAHRLASNDRQRSRPPSRSPRPDRAAPGDNLEAAWVAGRRPGPLSTAATSD
jgi:hypothetical protein